MNPLCPECKLVTVFDKSEFYCPKCGLVIEDFNLMPVFEKRSPGIAFWRCNLSQTKPLPYYWNDF